MGTDINVGTDMIGGDRLTQNTMDSESKKNPGAGWVGGWVGGQERFYNPLWLFRAQLGFRIQVRAECGNNNTGEKYPQTKIKKTVIIRKQS